MCRLKSLLVSSVKPQACTKFKVSFLVYVSRIYVSTKLEVFTVVHSVCSFLCMHRVGMVESIKSEELGAFTFRKQT
jgi:hypothetical protein